MQRNPGANKKILIVSSYLSNIGGTEIEAIAMSILFSNSKKFKKVTIFSQETINPVLLLLLESYKNIHVKSFPRFYYSKTVKKVDDFFLKIGFQYRLSRMFYVRYLIMQYSCFFIISYPNSTISNLFAILSPKNKKVIYKITMRFALDFEATTVKGMRNVNTTLVFNKFQKQFLEKKYAFKNIDVCDIPILMEKELLALPHGNFDNKIIKFGFLGRFAVEKNIMDMIRLMEFLQSENIKFDFHITGYGEEEHLNKIKNYISTSNLSAFIHFTESPINPFQVADFYKSIDVFLITSFHEGGPITGLEALAAGKMIFSYKVGSMEERLKGFDYVLADDFDQLCSNVKKFVNLSDLERKNFTVKLRDHYLVELSNHKKQTKIISLIN